MKIGTTIRRLRSARGRQHSRARYTQAACAKRAGISTHMWSRIENDLCDPKWSVVKKALGVLGYDIFYRGKADK